MNTPNISRTVLQINMGNELGCIGNILHSGFATIRYPQIRDIITLLRSKLIEDSLTLEELEAALASCASLANDEHTAQEAIVRNLVVASLEKLNRVLGTKNTSHNSA